MKYPGFILLMLLQFSGQAQDGSWAYYGQDAGGSRYSPLKQINDRNVAQLKVAWTYRTGELETYKGTYALQKAAFECTPILIGRTLYISTPSNRVIAVDGSAEMVDAASQRLADFRNVEIRTGELEALPIKDRELDAALLSLVLHYSAEPVRTLTEVARVCCPGAKVLVVDMLPHHHEEYQQQMGHVWLGFSEKQIVKFLTAAGFEGARVRALPVDPDAKGPALFAAIATRVTRD